MAIFDELRGLVPLPKSRKGKSTSDFNSSLAGVSDDVFSPEFPIALPEYTQPDLSNTFIDNIYTKINDVFEYIHLPTPEIIQGLYGVTQRIEGIIEDPVTFVRNEVNQTIYDLLHPKNKNLFPKDQHKSYKKPEEVKALEVIDDTSGTTGLRASLVNASSSKLDNKFQDPYDLPDLEEIKLDREFKGRESVENITLRSVDLWDIKIEPFEYNNVRNSWVPDIKQQDVYKLNSSSLYSKVYPRTIPRVSDYMPILSYNLDLKTLTTKQLELFGGSSIAVPDLIRYTSQLSIQIVDDENKRWRRWFQEYSENLYSSDTNSVAAYKNSSLLITLYQYRQDHKILSHNKYICSLMNYQMISTGAGDASTDVLDIEFSIVGKVDLPPNYSYLEIV